MQLRSDWFKDDIDTGNYFPLQFGRWTEEDNQLDRTFKGLLDDFRVYDDGLHASDILNIYGNGSGICRLFQPWISLRWSMAVRLCGIHLKEMDYLLGSIILIFLPI